MRVLVAGASTGIGRAVAEALASDGHDVIGCARRPMEKTLYWDYASGGRLRFDVCDVRFEDSVQALYRKMRDSDQDLLDALIVAVGVFGAIGKVPFTGSDAWWDALQTNVLGAYYLVKHGVPFLQRGERPRILFFAGGGAFHAFPRYSAYAASKAALVRFMECLAIELGPEIAVNAVSPGMVDTEIHQATVAAGPYRAGRVQFQKTLEMQETNGWVPMAVPVNCVRYLLSKEADGLTGRTIAAAFDPWERPGFAAETMADRDRYTLRRVQPDAQGG